MPLDPHLVGHDPDGRPIHRIAGGDDSPADAGVATADAGGDDATPKGKADGTGSPPEAAPPAAAVRPPAADLVAITHERDAAKEELGRAQKELERLQKAEKERADAERSELERAQERIAELERKEADDARRLGEVTLRAAAQTEALRLGYRRPERAYREIDLADVEFGDEGEPANLRTLLEAELTARPELKVSAPLSPDAGAGERGRTTVTREHIREMARKDPRWVNQHWDEVQEVLGRPGR